MFVRIKQQVNVNIVLHIYLIVFVKYCEMTANTLILKKWSNVTGVKLKRHRVPTYVKNLLSHHEDWFLSFYLTLSVCLLCSLYLWLTIMPSFFFLVCFCLQNCCSVDMNLFVSWCPVAACGYTRNLPEAPLYRHWAIRCVRLMRKLTKYKD